ATLAATTGRGRPTGYDASILLRMDPQPHRKLKTWSGDRGAGTGTTGASSG
ncbi:hypothetical protein Tco_1170694, partial [Tanacetum coccineum]